tara:strand:+ start:3742 stop:4059 length:318 start_codon:yes stop_codon:yes gene_type:complete
MKIDDNTWNNTACRLTLLTTTNKLAWYRFAYGQKYWAEYGKIRIEIEQLTSDNIVLRIKGKDMSTYKADTEAIDALMVSVKKQHNIDEESDIRDFINELLNEEIK